MQKKNLLNTIKIPVNLLKRLLIILSIVQFALAVDFKDAVFIENGIYQNPFNSATNEFMDFFASGTSIDMASIFQNIGEQIDPIKNFLIILCYVIGVGMSVAAVMKLKKYGTRTAFMHVEMSMVGPFLQFFVGVGLFYMPYFISSLNLTIFNTDTIQTSILSWSGSSGDDFDTYVTPILGVIQIIGIISFIRGWVMLAKATNPGQQPGAISKGITHVIGGILAVNIYTFIEVVYQTLGLS
ncbi:MAG: hypothetical protein VX737_05415 [Pseudomonadota bacterium]|nr:hypothetical protein [Pseudomonadota bacterium]